MRSAPSTGKPAIDTLFAADNVNVTQRLEETLTLKGITANWVKISYTKNAVQREGYIWSGLLAFNPIRRGDTKFFYGANRIVTKDTILNKEKVTVQVMQMEIKVYQQGKKFTSLVYPLIYNGESFSFTESKLYDGKGLKDVERVLSIMFSGEACGVPTDTYYFGIRRNEIVPVISTTDIGDADVYYHTEELIFPSDKGGKPDIIAWNMEEGESTEKADKKGNTIYKVKKDKKRYAWDGIKVKEMK
ncbi:MAG: hypothetical protein J0I41_18855 [Filimonas sp.]|nr:hypothetical protein [Filimonas sp.]